MRNRVIRSCTIATMHPPGSAGPPQATHCPRQATRNAVTHPPHLQTKAGRLGSPARHHRPRGARIVTYRENPQRGVLPGRRPVACPCGVLRFSGDRDGCDTVTRQASRGEVAEASEVRPPKLWAGATLGSRHLDWLGAFPDSTAGCAPHSSAGQWRTSQHSRHSRWRQHTAGVIPASLARVH